MKKIPDSELEVMMAIWDAGESVTSDDIMKRLKKHWAKTTLLNFLSRLCDRGFLRCHKKGRRNVYEALVNKEDYLRNESKNFFRKMHRNSITSLVASLYGGNSITKEDLKELKRFIEGAE